GLRRRRPDDLLAHREGTDVEAEAARGRPGAQPPGFGGERPAGAAGGGEGDHAAGGHQVARMEPRHERAGAPGRPEAARHRRTGGGAARPLGTDARLDDEAGAPVPQTSTPAAGSADPDVGQGAQDGLSLPSERGEDRDIVGVYA